MSKLRKTILGTVVLLMSVTSVAAKPEHSAAEKQWERGRYLVKIGGCNDCHTPGYAQSGGAVPEKDWLVGDRLGWQGPWGTTYPPNLRLYMQTLSEKQWVKTAHTREYRPPMPWFALHAMTTRDLKAIYHFVRHLGPAGEAAPAYLPPGQVASGPVVQFPAPPKK
ncbi:cytochrome C [Mangrovitalea sediminis]|uniref:cytochrome C n=1 Tax=Mangrovitalea sediminis TaxID=1982043 RepID=UPI000BE505EF|nr:cytochrome C [Mangrovitalea sediminis]